MSIALLSSFVSAIGDPIKKKLVEHLDPLTAVAYRGLIVAPLFWLAALVESYSNSGANDLQTKNAAYYNLNSIKQSFVVGVSTSFQAICTTKVCN